MLCTLSVRTAPFWNKDYGVITSVHDVTNKILSRDSNYIVDVITWLEKPLFFEGLPWFKFNNLGVALGTNLKSYTSVAKGLKLNVRKFCWLIPTFVGVTGEKLVRGAFFPPLPSLIGLKPSHTTIIKFVAKSCNRHVFPYSHWIREIRIRKAPKMDTFYAVLVTP